MVSNPDRRASPRITDSMPVKVSRLKSSSQLDEDDTYCINVSSSGIFFSSQLDLQEGEKIDLQIMPLSLPIAEFGLVIRASATVTRAVKEFIGLPLHYVAARFDSTPRIEKL
jgi:hypothetical protein